MNAAETIEERRFECGLAEIEDGVTPPDLRDRIRTAWETEQPGADSPERRGLRWLPAAALILLGIAIVFVIALQSDRDPNDGTRSTDEQRDEPQHFDDQEIDRGGPDWAVVTTTQELEALPHETAAVMLSTEQVEDIATLIRRCPDLQQLSVGSRRLQSRSDLTDADLAQIATLHKLRHLDISRAKNITTTGLRELRHLPRLESLAIGGLRFAELDLAVLADLPALIDLDASESSSFDGNSMRDVLELRRLRALNLTACSMIDSAELARIAELDDLRVLHLDFVNGRRPARGGRGQHYVEGRGITERVARSIASLPVLETLSLRDCRLPAAAIRSLGGAPRLRSLDIGQNPQLDDTTLRILMSRLELRGLGIAYCSQISADTMNDLADEHSLEWLDVSGLEWVEQTIRERLRSLPNLQQVRTSLGTPLRLLSDGPAWIRVSDRRDADAADATIRFDALVQSHDMFWLDTTADETVQLDTFIHVFDPTGRRRIKVHELPAGTRLARFDQFGAIYVDSAPR